MDVVFKVQLAKKIVQHSPDFAGYVPILGQLHKHGFDGIKMLHHSLFGKNVVVTYSDTVLSCLGVFAAFPLDSTTDMPRSFMRSCKAALWFFALPFQPKFGLIR